MNSNRGDYRDFPGGSNRSRGNEDYEATQYIPRSSSAGYDPDADFAGGRSDNETRFETRYDENAYGASGAGRGSGGGADGAGSSGQYWAPLSDEERDPAPGVYSSDRSRGGDDGRYSDGYSDGESRGMGSTVKTLAITAVVAIVALVVILGIFLATSGGGNSDSQSSAAGPSSSTRSSSSTTPSTSTTPPSSTPPPTSEAPPEASGPSVSDAQQRLEEEMNRLQETPPALPGFGDVTSGYGSVPADLVGKSPLTAEAELRINGFQNITIYDANGNVTNSGAAIMGKVASVDPAPGSEVETSTPINVYLQ